MEDDGLEREGTSVEKTLAALDVDESYGAYLVHSVTDGVPWQELRGLISDCPDLPTDARQSLVAKGDEAAGMACRETLQDHQAEE